MRSGTTLRALLAGAGMVAVASFAGCGRSGAPDDVLGDVFLGGPVPIPDLSPHVAPSPDPTPLPFGDGSDGGYAPVAGPHRPTPCWRLIASSSGDLVLAAGQGTGAALPLAGDLLLLLQTQGYSATSGDAAAVSASDTAGRWQLSLVLGTNADGSVVVSPPPAFEFRTRALATAQACGVPQYGDATLVNGVILEAHPWDGQTGGVVALAVDGSLSMAGNARITTFGRGFRGGPDTPGSGAFVNALDTPATSGGRKGEGIDPRSFALYGKGNYANGAGGGQSNDGGGGGGGGAAAGGFGGRTFQSADDNRRGLGGAAVLPSLDRMFFGGGGGGGHENAGGTRAAGGNGGGITFLLVRNLVGTTGNVIEANGSNGEDPNNNGAGGAGGGGTVRLVVETEAYLGQVDVSGGVGGDCDNDHGPGGGGGGGVIFTNAPLMNAIDIDLDGGDAGDPDNGNPRGQSNGAIGVQMPLDLD